MMLFKDTDISRILYTGIITIFIVISLTGCGINGQYQKAGDIDLMQTNIYDTIDVESYHYYAELYAITAQIPDEFRELTIEELGEIIVAAGLFWEEWWKREGGFSYEHTYGLYVQNMIVSANTWHTLAVLNGSLWKWGRPHFSAQRTLTPIKIMDNVIFTVAGTEHSLTICTNGTLWSWGHNFASQIGDETNENRFEPVKIMDNIIYATISPGTVNSHARTNVRSYAVKQDGTLWAWGENTDSIRGDIRGTLGDGTTEERNTPIQIMSNVLSVTPTLRGGFAITADNELWGWYNTHWHFSEDNNQIKIVEQLYPIKIKDNVVFIQVYYCTIFVIDANGALWLLSCNNEPLKIINSCAVSAFGTNDTFFVITYDKSLWAWGRNRKSNHWQWNPFLGDGTLIDRNEPVLILENVTYFTISADTAFAITHDGTLWAWGENTIGQLGNGTMNPQLYPTKIMENVVTISSAFYIDHGWISFINTFVFTEDGSLWAWGGNGFGAEILGIETLKPHIVPTQIIFE